MQVVQRDDGATVPTEGERVLEVRELGAKPSQHPRQRPGHAKLLRPRRQRDRLDAVRDEFRPPRHSGEVKVGRDERQLPQEVQDVCLLAGPVPAEHVRVEHDHATAS